MDDEIQDVRRTSARPLIFDQFSPDQIPKFTTSYLMNGYDRRAPVIRTYDHDQRIFQPDDSPKARIDCIWTNSLVSKAEERKTCPVQIQSLRDIEDLPDAGHFVFYVDFSSNSMSRLQSSRKLLNAVTSKYSLTPRFREFVMLFGFKSIDYDVSPPTCRFRLPKQGFDLCYAYRYIESRPEKSTWSVRQTAIAHKYAQGRSTLFLIGASDDVKNLAEVYIKGFEAEFGPNELFALHAAVLDSSLAKYRPYITDLSKTVHELTSNLLAANVDVDPEIWLNRDLIKFDDRQKLKAVEDKVLDLRLILNSTLSTITSIDNIYSSIEELIKGTSKSFHVTISLRESKEQTEMYLKRSDSLHQRIRGAAEVLSNLLAHSNAVSLKVLAQDAKEDNVAMRRLTEKTTSDSRAMRIITAVTVIFLPSTVVASFFSTQFVRADSNGLSLAPSTWIFFAVTIPLTLITIAGWAWLPNAVPSFKKNFIKMKFTLSWRKKRESLIESEA